MLHATMSFSPADSARPGRRLICCLATLIVCGLAAPAWAVNISEPRWGFDGKIRQQRFNILTVTVDNPSQNPVEFDLVLTKTNGGVNHVDVPVVERVYLAGGQRRSVQFYPYISEWGSWRLRIGGTNQSIDISQPRPSRRGARVLLESSEIVADTRGAVRRFPEGEFPPFVTATDTLQAVLIDHVPNLPEARRQALLDWIYRGGAVYVLLGPNGKFPQFPGTMQELNSPLDFVPYGSGVIRHVSLTRTQLTKETAKELWRQLPNVFVPESLPEEAGVTTTKKKAYEDDDDDEVSNMPFSYSDGSNSITARSFLEELGKMTKPDHNWLLLHFMFWVYILLIFPGCFLIGQKRNDFRVVYAALGAIVFVFSLAFGIVGQRGYGESSTINSVAIVQPLPNGFVDVTEWSNAFITSGGVYDITHLGAGTIYSTCQEAEAVDVKVQNGAEALFKVDIPPFSSREFAHRMKVKATLPAVQVVSSAADARGLNQLTLEVDKTFPQADEMYVLYRDRFYSLARQQNRIQLRSNIGSVPAFLRMEQNNNNYYPGWGNRYGREDDRPEARYRDMFHRLVTRSLNIRTLDDAQAVRWSPDRVRLIYYADLRPEFAVQNSRFLSQKGKALYCVDLPLIEGEPQKTEENAN